MARFDSLLAPSSVAVVGASDNPESFGSRLWRYLSRGYTGTAIPVNPRLRWIDGVACVPRLQDLDRPPETVVFATSADTTLRLLADAGSVGARAAIIFSRELLGREPEVLAAARQSAMTVLGPNCLGLINANAGVAMSSSVSLERPCPPGPFAFVSQSGALMGLVHAWSLDLGVRLGLAISTGSQAMVRTEDLLLELADHEDIRAVAVYLEDLDPPLFAAAASLLAERAMRLVALKGGASELGSEVTATHSGALASSGGAFRSFARELGVVVIDDPGELLPALAATSTRGRRWHVVTSSGGLAAIAADRATTLGLALPPAPPGKDASGTGLLERNPTDLDATASTTREKVEAIRARAGDRDIDGVLVVLNDSPDLPEIVRGLKPVCGDGLGRILVAAECSQQFADLWRDWAAQGSALFPSLSSALKVLMLVHHEEAHLPATPWSGALVPQVELQSLLQGAGMPVLAAHEVDSPEDACRSAEALGYPVVCKVSRASHRGPDGVRANLATPGEVAAACRELAVHGPVLVQAQCPPGLEFYVGIRTDPVFGQLVLVGAGGTAVEAEPDVAIGRSPMDARALQDLLGSTQVGRWLANRTSRDFADLASLVSIAERAMRVVADPGAALRSLDLNPVVVHASGATVVDAKAVPATSAQDPSTARWADQESVA